MFLHNLFIKQTTESYKIDNNYQDYYSYTKYCLKIFIVKKLSTHD